MTLYKLLTDYLNDLLEDYPRQEILDTLAEWIKETSEYKEELVDYDKLESDVLEEIL